MIERAIEWVIDQVRIESLVTKVLGVKVVDAHVAILTARCEAPPVRIEHERIDGAEVTPDITDLGLKDLVEEDRLEFPLPARGGGHLVRRLAASNRNLQSSTESVLFPRVDQVKTDRRQGRGRDSLT